MLWQSYYNIGKGIIQPYGNVRFTSSNNVIVPFTSTSEESFQHPSKKRVHRSLCTLLFCAEYGCGQVFENSIDYEIISFKDVNYHLVISLLSHVYASSFSNVCFWAKIEHALWYVTPAIFCKIQN